jgi:hypothetical protein
MKYGYLLLAAIFLVTNPVDAQKEIVRNDTTYLVTYFTSGEISTLTTKLDFGPEFRDGTARAFRRDGTRIYKQNIRRYAGHASVRFSFYDDGAVSKAHYTSQPDGGIQRYDVTHLFDQQGNVTEVIDMSDDGFGPSPRIFVEQTPPPVVKKEPQPKQEVMECAVLYQGEVFVINMTGKPVTTIIGTKGHTNPNFARTEALAPGDTLRAGNYIGAQIHYAPTDQFSISAAFVKPKKKSRIQYTWDTPKEVSKEHRRYYLLLMEVKK